MTTDIYLHNDKQPYDVWETVTVSMQKPALYSEIQIKLTEWNLLNK